MANINELVAELTDLSNVETSEKISTGSLQKYIEDAVKAHDKQLTVQTLPPDEEEPVLTLAWIKVCLIRAAKFSKQSNLAGGQGFGSDSKTPYDKQMNMVKSLTERYSDLCGKLRINRNGIVLGQLFVRDDIFDAVVPLFETPDMPPIHLSLAQASNNNAIIQWKTDKNFSDFFQCILIYLESPTDCIFQKWNFDSAVGIPNLNNSAAVLHTFNDPTVLSAKVQNLDMTATHRFMVVWRTRTYRYVYSNEITVTPLNFATPIACVTQEQLLGGCIIVSATPPDVSANSYYANCIWLQPSSTGGVPTLYVWDGKASVNAWVPYQNAPDYEH